MGANTDRIDSRDKLEQEIKKLESAEYGAAVKPSLPDVKLDEIRYDAPTDAAIKDTAENDLAQYKTDGERSVREKNAADAAALKAERETYENGRRASDAELAQRYESSARAIDNDVIKRGLARSSVAVVERGELEREYLARSADIAEAYGKNVARIDSEIASLDKKLQQALNDFNLSYAVKLNQRIAELKTERDKRADEAVKYNNEVRKSQAKLDSDRIKSESGLYTDALEQEKLENSLSGLPAERREELYKSVYAQMDAFLGSLTPQQALLEIRNHTLYRKHLSNYYYNRLYDKYGREDR